MLIFLGIAFVGGFAVLIVGAAVRIILSLFLPKTTMAAIDAGTRTIVKVFVKIYIVAMAALICWIVYLAATGGR